MPNFMDLDLVVCPNNVEEIVVQKDLFSKMLPETKEVFFLIVEFPIELGYWIKIINYEKMKRPRCKICKRTFKKFLFEIYSEQWLKIYDELFTLVRTLNRKE